MRQCGFNVKNLKRIHCKCFKENPKIPHLKLSHCFHNLHQSALCRRERSKVYRFSVIPVKIFVTSTALSSLGRNFKLGIPKKLPENPSGSYNLYFCIKLL
ncbi:hypothetical protein C2I18_07665 [Paenibacillus sp. PK3_47]|nr:hypothetical protein C2I18_07665 [Paenibacillus sp. PK3_47]